MEHDGHTPVELPTTNTLYHQQGIQERPPPPYSDNLTVPFPTDSDVLTTRPLLSSRQHPTRTVSSNSLLKPIAIPATTPKLGSPFLRAYPPSLEGFGLTREVFLHFLDDLNRIAVANPPLQVLGLAGTIVSFVPLATAQIVGSAVNTAATIGTIAVSKGRTELFMRQANKDIFSPRGLKIEIAKIDALAQVAGIPILNAVRKVDKNAPLLAPIEDLAAIESVTGQERRLQTLEPYIAHLDLQPLPDIDVPKNPLSKLSIAASERMRKKGEKDMMKDRGKAFEDYHKDADKAQEDYEKEMRKLDKESRKARREKSPGKAEKELAKVEKEREKVERKYEKEMSKVEKDRVKDDKEEKGMRKILWLIIRNLDADSGSGPDPYMADEAIGQ